MASPFPAPLPQAPLSGAPNKPVIDLTGDPALIDSIVKNDSLPDRDITLGKLSAQIAGGTDFALPSAGGTISFKGAASADSSIAAYVNPGTLSSDLGFQSDDGQKLQLDFGTSSDSRWVVLRWDYAVSGNITGSMALAPYGSVTFGVDGASGGLYAIVRREAKNLHAQDAFLDVVKSWIIPSSVNSPLPLGTWLITEVEGQLSAKLGVQLGYDFNWVKHAELQGLSGDIGLRLQLGLNAAFSALLAGKFIMVLSCEDVPNVVRLRLFRSTKKGWAFALNAGAEVDTSTGDFLPEKLDDFIQAVFGIHDAQLLQYLHAASLQEMVDDLGSQFLGDLVPSHDPAQAFAAIGSVFSKWDALPHQVTSVIWKYLSQGSVINEIKSVANQIATANQQTLTTLLDGFLKDAGFPGNPVSQWLEAAAGQALFPLYESLAAKTQLTQSAKLLLQILDSDQIESVLTKLKNKVDTVLDFGTLETAIQNNSVVGIAKWVQEQLAKFVGVDTSALSTKLGQLDQIIKLVRSKSQQFYEATRKALNNKYAFSLQYAYQSSNLSSALIDVEFGATGFQFLPEAVRGDFSRILSSSLPGVSLRSATLTHSLERQSHIEVHLPFYTGTADHVQQAFASANFVDSENGRIQLFEAGAKDEFVQKGSRNSSRYAACSLGISGVATGVRKYNVKSVDFGYSFRMQRPAMTRSEFTYQFKPLTKAYFPNVFGDATANSQHAVFDSWVADWDKFTDQHPTATPDGDGVIGNTWASFQVRVPGDQDLDWVSALLNGQQDPNLKAMSLAMQKAYRTFLFQSYSTDPRNLANISGPAIDPFLAYVCFTPATGLRLDGDTLVSVQNGDLMWDVADKNLVRQVLLSPSTISGMQMLFANIFALLNGIPSLKSSAGFYTASSASSLAAKIAADDFRLGLLCSYLEHEDEIIQTAAKAFKNMRKAGSQRLGDALDAFAAAGIQLTDAFNTKLGGMVFDTAHIVQYFAPLMFQTAVSAMYPGKAPKVMDAILDVAVLNSPTLTPTNDPPPSANVLLRQHLLNFS